MVTCSGLNLTATPRIDFTADVDQLFFHSNRITELGAFMLATAPTNVAILNFDNNTLTRVDVNAFFWFRQLVTLTLNANLLSELPTGALSNLSLLAGLSLSDNRLTAAPLFPVLPVMEQITLDGNPLVTFAALNFAGVWPTLTSLTVRNSLKNISSLPADQFSRFQTLKYLDLSRGALAFLPDDIFAGPPSRTLVGVMLQVTRACVCLVALLSFQRGTNIFVTCQQSNNLAKLPTSLLDGLKYNLITMSVFGCLFVLCEFSLFFLNTPCLPTKLVLLRTTI